MASRVVGPVITPSYSIPINVFRGVHWAGFAICLIAFSGRMYIRLVCLRRFLVEDFLVFVALLFLLTTSVYTLTDLQHVYNTSAVALGEAKPSASFWADSLKGHHALLVQLVLSVIGLWLVKLNFLLFFRRLIWNLSRKYRIFWWFVLVVTLGCGVATFALIPFKCLVGDPETTQRVCIGPSELRASAIDNIASAILDVISDLLILCLPFFIVWRVRLTTRKKLILSIVFSMTLITVALTITRGAFFNEAYKDTTGKVLNTTWIFFWHSMELVVSILVACLVSFRTLFAAQANSKASRAQRLAHIHPSGSPRSKMKARAKVFYDSFLETCMNLEGSTQADGEMLVLPEPASGIMTVDFSNEDEDGWRKHLPKPQHSHKIIQ